MENKNTSVMQAYVPLLEWGIQLPLKNFLNNAPKEWFYNVPGGKAEGKEPSDFDLDAIIKGTATQLQHTTNPLVATEIAMDHVEEHDDYYDDDKGLPAMESGLENDEMNQHESEYMKTIEGKRAVDIIEFAIEEYGPDVVSDTKLMGFLKHLATDLGHVVEGDLAYINTELGPVHEKNK